MEDFAIDKMLIINSPEELRKHILISCEAIEFENLHITFPLTQEILIQISQTEEIKQNTIIEKKLTFDNIEIESLDLYNIEFTKSFLIRNSRIRKIWINDCRFSDHFSIFEDEDAITQSVSLLNSTFNDDVSLRLSLQKPIDNIDIQTCNFGADLKISGVLLYNKKNGENYIQIIEQTQISKSLIICDSLIGEEINLSCEIGKNLQFSNINYDIVSKVSKDIIVGKLCIYTSDINAIFSINQCAFDSIDISKSNINDFVEDDLCYNVLCGDAPRVFSSSTSIITDPVKRNKYRAELYERKFKDNIINALKSVIQKIDNYNVRKQTKQINNKSNRLRRCLKNIGVFLFSFFTSLTSGEKFILFLNKYSNNFNRSWFRGIVFTNIVAIIFFFLINYLGTDTPFFVINWTFDGFGEVLKEYIGLIDIFGLSEIGETESSKWNSLTPFGISLLFIARIFIVYGCWQTIYAFYKYQK